MRLHSRRYRTALIGLLAVLTVASRLNLFTAGRALDPDESFTYVVSQFAFPWGVVHATAGDVHPPLYYLITAIWLKFTPISHLTLRLPAAILGMLTVAAAWWFARVWMRAASERSNGDSPDALTEWTPFFLATAVALGPPFIGVSHLARMYTLLGVLTLIQATLALLCLRRSGKWHLWIGLGITAIASCYAHNYGLFLTVSVFTWLFLEGFGNDSNRRIVWSRTVVVGTIVLICYFPWMNILFGQAAQVSVSYWTPRLKVEHFISPFTQLFLVPSNIVPIDGGIVFVGMAAMCAMIWPWRWSPEYRLLSALFASHVLLIMLTNVWMGRAIFVPRYIIHLLPLILVSPCFWLTRIPDKLVRRLVWSWCFAGLALFAAALPFYYYPFRIPYAALVERIHAQVPDSAILVTRDISVYIHLYFYLDAHTPGSSDRLVMMPRSTRRADAGHVVFESAIPASRRITPDELRSHKGMLVWAVHNPSDSLPLPSKEISRNVFTELDEFGPINFAITQWVVD